MRSINSGALLTFIGIAAAFGAGCEHRGGVVLSVESPGKTYRVELTGRFAKPTLPMDEHHVRLNAWRGALPLAHGLEIHFADWFDSDFDYGPVTWPQENVLRFGPPLPAKGVTTRIRVRNESHRTVSCLKVRDRDLFVFFELVPGAVSAVSTSETVGESDRAWVDAAGEWADGKKIREKGRDFPVPTGLGCCEYLVTISDSGVSFAENPLGLTGAPPNTLLDPTAAVWGSSW